MSGGSEGFAHPEFLIETEGLADRLGDPELRVFDCTIHLIPNSDIGYTVKPGREDGVNPARNPAAAASANPQRFRNRCARPIPPIADFPGP